MSDEFLNVCKLMEETEDDNENLCRSCSIGILLSWYIEELKKSGKEDLAKPLEAFAFDEQVSEDKLCRMMTETIQKTSGPLKERLVDLNRAFNKNHTREGV